jgi:ferredoxin
MAKIVLNVPECIGCGSCAAVCSDFFEMGDDGKSHLKGGKKSGEKEVLEIEQDGCAKEAAESCPAGVISVS